MRRGSRLSRRRRRGEEERRGEERRRGGEEEQATDIKSNNPHLAGVEFFFHFFLFQNKLSFFI